MRDLDVRLVSDPDDPGIRREFPSIPGTRFRTDREISFGITVDTTRASAMLIEFQRAVDGRARELWPGIEELVARRRRTAWRWRRYFLGLFLPEAA